MKKISELLGCCGGCSCECGGNCSGGCEGNCEDCNCEKGKLKSKKIVKNAGGKR